MGKVGATGLFTVLLFATLFTPVIDAHEQKTLTVIITEEGVVSGNISDPAFVQGNALWFQMHDDTENTTMVIRLDMDMDGLFNESEDFESETLVSECALDENGSLVDESCAVSTTFAFDMNATVGTYLFWVVKTQNGIDEVWNQSVTVHKDVHEEEGPSPGDCFGFGCESDDAPVNEEGEDASFSARSQAALLMAILALVGMVGLSLSIVNERNETKVYALEEE